MLTVVPVVWPTSPGEPLPDGLLAVLRGEGRLRAGAGVDGGGATGLLLPDAGAVVLASGLADLTGLGLAEVWHGPSPAAVFLPPVALTFAVAVALAVGLGVPVALLLAEAVAVEVAVAVAELLTLPLGLPLVLPPLGLLVVALLLGPPLTGVVAEPVAGTLGGRPAWDDPAVAADDEADGQALTGALLGLAEAPPWVAVLLLCAPAALPEPSRPWLPPALLGLDEEIPTAEPSWTKASRSGGSARTTPMAKTAQAAARAGLSRPSRQSRGRCRPRAGSWSPFRRAARPARKPAGRLLARTGPDRTRARIRSSPSEWGSTWSAAACSARRRYSPKSMGSGPCGGMPSDPGLVITRAPGPRAGRTCRGRCGS